MIAALTLLACGPASDPGGALTTATSNAGLYQLSVFTDPQPPVRGVLSARLVLTDPKGAPAGGLQLTVTPWMPQHGHGSSVEPQVSEPEPGTYQVTNLYLPMAGIWQLRTTIHGEASDEADPSIEVR